MPSCKNCQKEFTITHEDKKFYERIGVPEPTLCPDCRAQQRLCWRNERTLYQRLCAKTGKETISMYSPDSPLTVYEQGEWWKDDWDTLAYGREFDFSRPLFSQLAELHKIVPRFSLYNINSINSDFVSYARDNKNCYLCFSMVKNEDCCYCNNTDGSRDCLDCFGAKDQCEMCYEGVDIDHCYNSNFIQNCSNLIDCWFCYNCVGCDNCFGCANLRNAKYYWFNQQLTKDEYQKKLKQADSGSFKSLEDVKEKFYSFVQKFPRKYLWVTKAINSFGDYLLNTKNVRECFDLYDSEDCAYSSRCLKSRDCYDVYGGSDAELMYQNVSAGVGSDSFFSLMSYYNQNIRYCYSCFSSQSLFGCISVRNKKYCILNKQYAEEEYNRLIPKIIEHLRQTKEWGEFYPPKMSPFGYNETLAQENFPLTKEEAIKQGFNWQDKMPFTKGGETLKTANIPDKIGDIDDNILKEVLACRDCGKNYKIIKRELEFYRQKGLPLPRRCFNCRHLNRLKLRNPRKLWDRQCGQCGAAIKTSYAPDRPEKILCEECYQKEIY